MRSLSLPLWAYKLGSLDPSAACEEKNMFLVWMKALYQADAAHAWISVIFFSVQESPQSNQGFNLDRPFESWGDLTTAETAEPAEAEAPASWLATLWVQSFLGARQFALQTVQLGVSRSRIWQRLPGFMLAVQSHSSAAACSPWGKDNTVQEPLGTWRESWKSSLATSRVEKIPKSLNSFWHS